MFRQEMIYSGKFKKKGGGKVVAGTKKPRGLEEKAQGSGGAQGQIEETGP